MLTRNWRWGTSIAFQFLTARAFQTASSSTLAHHPHPAFIRASNMFPSILTTALSVSTSTTTSTTDESSSISINANVNAENPLLRSWSDQPFNLPPFKSIQPSHFQPALESAMEAHLSDLETIASSPNNEFDSILGASDR